MPDRVPPTRRRPDRGLGRTAGRPPPGRGQATVEFALIVPAVLVVILVVVEVALVARDRVAVEHAARAAARAAVVSPDVEAVAAAARAATHLSVERLQVTLAGDRSPGGLVEVQVRYRAPIHVPLLRVVPTGPTLTATLFARVEGPVGGHAAATPHPVGHPDR